MYLLCKIRMKEDNKEGEVAGHLVLRAEDLSKEMISVLEPFLCLSARNSSKGTTGVSPAAMGSADDEYILLIKDNNCSIRVNQILI